MRKPAKFVPLKSAEQKIGKAQEVIDQTLCQYWHQVKPVQAEQKQKQDDGGKNKVVQIFAQPTKTRDELAKAAGVSHDTIEKVKKIERDAPAELKPVIQAEAKKKQAQYYGNQYDALPQKSAEVQKPIETRDELANVAGVSHDTIAKVEKIERDAPAELKPVIAERAKEKETERKTTFLKSGKSPMPTINTTRELAKVAGVGSRRRSERTANKKTCGVCFTNICGTNRFRYRVSAQTFYRYL